MTTMPGNCLNLLKVFAANAKGNLTVVAAIGLLAITIASGSALDYGHALQVRIDLQSKLDASVLAGASGSTDEADQIKTAEAFFEHATKGLMPVYSATFTSTNGVLSATGRAVVPMTLMGIGGIKSMTVAGKSKAQSADVFEPMCVMAMHPTRSHTLELDGSVSINAPDCNFYGNSNNTDDVIDPHQAQNFLTAKSVATIGGGHHYLQNVTPAPVFGTTVIADPLADLTIPTGGSTCKNTKYVIDNKNLTLPEGLYCDGLVVKNGSSIRLQKNGVYYIKGNAFQVNASSVTGDNVTIVLVDSKATINWQSATIKISAPQTGDYAGLAIVADRTSYTTNTIKNSTVDIEGVLYMPKGAFTWTNSGTPAVSAKWTAFIADGFSWDGSGTITIPFDLEASSVPYPSALNKIPSQGKVRLLN
jgi:septal ring-binding cell division protein DamX